MLETLEIIGDIILCLCIIAGVVTFTVANVNYMPEDDDNNT